MLRDQDIMGLLGLEDGGGFVVWGMVTDFLGILHFFILSFTLILNKTATNFSFVYSTASHSFFSITAHIISEVFTGLLNIRLH